MLGVPGALLATRRARAHARLEQWPDDKRIPLAGPRKDPRGRLAQIGARLTERDAGAHRGDFLLDEIRVCTGDTGLQTAQARIDRGCEIIRRERRSRTRSIEHLAGVTHKCHSRLERSTGSVSWIVRFGLEMLRI
jgi:hypothetical protein